MADGRARAEAWLKEDIEALSTINWQKPFASVEEACDRLLPYHLWLGDEAEEADADEASQPGSPPLLASREDAWEEMCARKSREHLDRVEELRRRGERVLEKDESCQAPSEFLVEALLQKDVRGQVLQLRREVSQLHNRASYGHFPQNAPSPYPQQ